LDYRSRLNLCVKETSYIACHESHKYPTPFYLLGLGTVDELGADLLDRLDVARSEGDANLVDLWSFAEVFVALVVRHFEYWYAGHDARTGNVMIGIDVYELLRATTIGEVRFLVCGF
jgi:hypothetical protein